MVLIMKKFELSGRIEEKKLNGFTVGVLMPNEVNHEKLEKKTNKLIEKILKKSRN